MRPAVLLALAAVTLAAALAAGQPQVPGTLTYDQLRIDAVLVPGGAEFALKGSLVNTLKEPAVPGYGYIMAPDKLLGVIPLGPARPAPIRISGVHILVDGKPVDYRVDYVNGTAVLKYSIWRPILPGERVRVEVSFTAEGVAAEGVLFREYSLAIGFPHERVREAVLSVSARGGWLCYTSVPGGQASYRGLEPGSTIGVDAEVSKYIPLPLLPFPGSLLVWGLVIAAGIAVLAYRRFKRG